MNIKWNAKGYTKDFQFVHQYGEDVLNLLDIEKGMKVLDLGCGNGALTKKISDMGADVIGMDASGEMLEIAKRNYPELTFIEDDAVKFILNEQVDAIFSNAVFHWIDNQDGLLQSVYNGLKINGSLVCEFGGYGCTETIHSFLQKAFETRGLDYKRTFYFPTIDEYTPILKKHGLQTVYAALFDRKTALIGEDGMKNWIEMFVIQPFKGLDDSLKNEIIDETVKSLKPILYQNGVWYADYVRIRLKARKI
ncbi:class I SAM-dependent methyltransferase [Clostridium beijerinckii]|uniref:Trans-aconitate methyltransferase n=1 Tax=Clostridium beijerinckii TaxID=1520 RepID=A0A9Q5CQR1_CLOBE|nr:class I SAM-dependent methyltransferase [Clostridium beijerinckii]AQS05604.1 trans-aconitate 2-methyltransferase [Clostridium beijerinckii]MBA2884887.1 trans-aconitate methyltransferase [Clostridium beijerinckii]MBA2899740.1 trans-aconitate methyltransferase [Clostridium beijerinckii]MBA2909238.1 trans-aconitate methyltransferase [Clostridium beijerinckii]MBA9014810.1 trans-aconitate methyltransferase [Clostridium beijerinckii]